MYAKLIIAAALLVPAVAYADNITDVITITTMGSVPAKASYTLTFDPTQQYVDATAGITENMLSDGDQIYVPFGFDYSYGTLIIGGLVNGVGSVYEGTDDYSFNISNFPYFPLFFQFFESTTDGVADGTFSGIVKVQTISVATTPEPSSIALLGTGLLGVAGVVRKRLS